MSVANETVKSLYLGDGVADTFAIPFDFIPASASSQIKVYLVDSAGEKVLQVEGPSNDYELDPPYNSVTNPAGPANVIFATAPPNTHRVLVERVLPITQIISYVDSGKFVAKTHERGMDRLTFMMQQIADKLLRVPVLNILDEALIAMDVPKAIPNGLLAINTAGDGFTWIDGASLAGGAGLGIPTGGLVGEMLAKKTLADFELEWISYAYAGYSARFSEAFATANLKETLDQIIDITYTAPQVSLSASGSGTIREKGTAVTAVTLSATVTKRSDPIAEVRFYKDGVLINTIASPNPAGGVETYNWTGSFSDNTSFSVQVDDDGTSGGPSTVSSTQSFTFVYPYFVGAGAAGLSAANVALLTKLTQVSTATVNRTITAAGGEVFFFAYPASYGALTSILDVNGFETLPDWTLRTENITALDTSTVSYRIYEFNNPVVAGDYYYSFRR